MSATPYVACFGIIGLLAALYVLTLEVMAVKGVNQFGWGQAIASLLLPLFVFGCCIAVGIFALVQAIGPNMSDIFNALTPVP